MQAGKNTVPGGLSIATLCKIIYQIQKALLLIHNYGNSNHIDYNIRYYYYVFCVAEHELSTI